jgi:exopolysaccharide biosynthesis WecB/TagA/CpsF family protein
MPVAFLNANNANIAQERPDLKRAFDHFLVLADGIGVDLASLVLHGAMFPENLNGTDLVPSLLKRCKSGLKVALLGTRRDVADSARDAFASMCPQHKFTVVADGFFNESDEPAILAALEELRPDILLVAMGVPRQELWITRTIDERHCTVPIAVGALFDIVTGTVPRAPNWMIKLRIEWVYRLWREPKRLWRRYLIGNPVFLGSIISAKLKSTSSASGDPRSLSANGSSKLVTGR